MAPQEAQGTRQLTEPLPPPMPTGSSFCSPSGTTSASAHSTSALRGLPAYQPDLSNILSIKSKREGSLRGGDEKVFVFYSGTIFSLRHFLYETFDAFLCPSTPQEIFFASRKNRKTTSETASYVTIQFHSIKSWPRYAREARPLTKRCVLDRVPTGDNWRKVGGPRGPQPRTFVFYWF